MHFSMHPLPYHHTKNLHHLFRNVEKCLPYTVTESYNSVFHSWIKLIGLLRVDLGAYPCSRIAFTQHCHQPPWILSMFNHFWGCRIWILFLHQMISSNTNPFNTYGWELTLLKGFMLSRHEAANCVLHAFLAQAECPWGQEISCCDDFSPIPLSSQSYYCNVSGSGCYISCISSHATHFCFQMTGIYRQKQFKTIHQVQLKKKTEIT